MFVRSTERFDMNKFQMLDSSEHEDVNLRQTQGTSEDRDAPAIQVICCI